MKRDVSSLFEEAGRYIPGGVNSPVRACGSVDADPLFISRASGSRIYDAEDREYVDYVCSWGPMIAGHAHPQVVKALREAIEKGTSYGAPTELEIEMARRIVEAVPSIDMVRMVNSGTEATMSAIRLARGYTGRKKVLKFEGCYHGHVDSLLVKAGSGLATLAIPGSPGVPEELAGLTVTIPYNDDVLFEAALAAHGDDIACVIVEPVAGNMGVVLPRPGFLRKIRDRTREKGIVLIFDEVITGFRVTYGGYQNLIGIDPDLTCLGKIIGGGLPVGAFGGRREIMEHLAPLGPVYQAGTLSGNPLAMAAGIATLDILRASDGYDTLDRNAARLCTEMGKRFTAGGIPHTVNRIGSMYTLFFNPGPVTNFTEASRSDTGRFARYYQGMRREGVYIAPSQFECSFLSLSHTDKDIELTVSACERVIANLSQ